MTTSQSLSIRRNSRRGSMWARVSLDCSMRWVNASRNWKLLSHARNNSKGFSRSAATAKKFGMTATTGIRWRAIWCSTPRCSSATACARSAPNNLKKIWDWPARLDPFESVGQGLILCFGGEPNNDHSDDVYQGDGRSSFRIAFTEKSHEAAHLPCSQRGENPAEIKCQPLPGCAHSRGE